MHKNEAEIMSLKERIKNLNEKITGCSKFEQMYVEARQKCELIKQNSCEREEQIKKSTAQCEL